MPIGRTFAATFRFRGWLLLWLGWSLVSLVETGVAAEVVSPSPSSAQPINTLAAYREAETSEGKDQPHPIDLDLVVNYFDPAWNLLWVESHGVTRSFPLSAKPPALRTGQHLRLTGTIIPEEGLSADRVKVSLLAENNLAAPVRGQLDRMEGKDGRIVAVEGLVERQFEPDPNHLVLDIITDCRKATCHIWHDGTSRLPQLQGSIVRVEGAFVGRFDPAHRLIAIDLWVSELPRVTPLTTLATDTRFAQPKTPIRDLGQVGEQALVHLTGTVQAYEPGHRLVVRDDSGSLALETEQTETIRTGEAVEVIGYTEKRDAEWTLRDLFFRPQISASPEKALSNEDTPSSKLTRVQDVLQLGLEGAEQGRLVELTGVVTFAHPDWRMFFLNDNGASVLVSLTDTHMLLPETGTTVSVKGKTATGTYSPTVQAVEVRSSAKQPMPRAKAVTLPQALTGNEDGQWVEMTGNLRQVEVLDGWLKIRLTAPTGDFLISIPGTDTPKIALGSLVRIRGICSVWTLNNTHRMGGFFLFSPSISQLEEIKTTETNSSAPLTVVEQVIQLRPEETNRARPVNLSGVVTFAHTEKRTFFLNDSSGGILISVTDPDTTFPRSGMLVAVKGVTASGLFAPSVVAREVSVEGNGDLPAARIVSLEQALTGAEESQWVEMRGTLRQIEDKKDWYLLTLTASAGEFTVSIPMGDTAPPAIGSYLRVRGVCVAWPNGKNQLGGIFLFTPSLRHIEVKEAAPADPFSAPEESISQLQSYRVQPVQQQQVRIRGTVLHHVPGRYLFVENTTGVVRALSRDTSKLTPGDQVDVVGVPGREGHQFVVRGAVYRRIGGGPVPQPVHPRGGLKLDPKLDGHLAKITGTLLDLKSRPEDARLFIQAGAAVYEVVSEIPLPARFADAWAPGSVVEVTGLYHIEYNEYDQPVQFSLQLRSPQDLTVLQLPPWWTAGRALACLGIIGACLVLGLTWAAALRRRVQHQTAMIRAQLEKEANLEARNRDIIDNASDFIFTTDLAGKFTSFNPAGERITGYTQQDALQLTIRDLIDPEDAASGTALLSLALAPEQNTTARFETRFKTRDGRSIWMETSARLVVDAGRPSGLLGVARDITERKQLEDELKRARNAAEANTQAKSAFLANMSHEIRTPMSGVIGMTNLLLDTPLRSDQREFAETIHSSAEALLTILNDILDFSKIEAGKLQFEAIDFDLVSQIDDSLSLLAARAVAKQIELAADISPALPRFLRGDPGRIRQVLLNLLGNAVKFTEKGEVVLTVSHDSETETDALIRIEVTDTGMGMSPAAQEQLFRPFTQADSSTTRKFGGTGLGLAISKQIIELMGGQIGVRSEVGRGSTFWFTLRLEKQPAAIIPAPLPELASVAGVRVLAVDDNATNRKIIRHYLEAWQMRCVTASSGPEALNLAAAAVASGDPYRVMLLDYHMLGMDGLALTKAIRENHAYDGVPILLLTSLDRRFTREELTQVGVGKVLIKPLRQGDLQKSILRLLGESAEVETRPPLPTAATMPATLVPAAAEVPANSPKVRVIVAEDNLVNQRIIQLQLKKLGVKADLATSGRDLLAALENNPYDLVFMDCQMPEMDGYEATRLLRASGRFPELRIIAMTANTMQGDREKCLACGMDDYLSKPTRPEDLRDTLLRWAPSLEGIASTPRSNSSSSV